eukprot:Skav235247  [mRNA]  locus=scaffold3995:332260:334398:+ [translate_table: standard]
MRLPQEERKAYHEARRAAQTQAAPKKQLTKAERRAVQEAQRKVKEESTKKVGTDEELMAELKLQGLSEDQAWTLRGSAKKCSAREMVKVMQEGEHLEGDDEDDAEEDLAASVVRWMNEQESSVERPTAVAKKLEAPLARWAPVLEPLYESIPWQQ